MSEAEPGDVFLFGDEATVYHAPTKRRMWAERGHPPVIKSPGGHKHLNMMGMVDPAGGEVVSAFVEEMNARVYIKFLRRVLWRYKAAKKIYIITDNAKIHHAIIVNNFLASINHKIMLLYIPPYSPELNPMEQVWKYMRETVTHNTFYPLFQDLKDTLRQFFEKLKNQNDEVRSRCSFY